MLFVCVCFLLSNSFYNIILIAIWYLSFRNNINGCAVDNFYLRMDPSRADSRYNLNYSMSSIGLSLTDQADIYGNPAAVAALGGRPPSGGLIHTMGAGSSGVSFNSRGGSLLPNSTQCQSLVNNSPSVTSQQRGIKRAVSDCYEDLHRGSTGSASMTPTSMQQLDSCTAGGTNQQGLQQHSGLLNAPDIDDNYSTLPNKKSPPANGKKTKGRVKIKMEYIDNKLRRYTTFSKRKTGIMKKAYELSTLTGTQVMLLVASETGHVYTFATRKLQPMITSEAGKQLIQTCLNSPDPPSVGGGDQRMSATGFEETELSYNITDEDSKDIRSPLSSNESEDSSDIDSSGPTMCKAEQDESINLGRNLKGKTPIDRKQKIECFINHTNIENMLLSSYESNTLGANQHLKDYQTGPVPVAAETLGENLLCSKPCLSNVPQEALLKLIKSGHLKLHNEEDGSGQQYVTIPLTSSSFNFQNSKIDTSTAPVEHVIDKLTKGTELNVEVSNQNISCKIKEEKE